MAEPLHSVLVGDQFGQRRNTGNEAGIARLGGVIRKRCGAGRSGVVGESGRRDGASGGADRGGCCSQCHEEGAACGNGTLGESGCGRRGDEHLKIVGMSAQEDNYSGAGMAGDMTGNL